jgi:hypothetical protein
MTVSAKTAAIAQEGLTPKPASHPGNAHISLMPQKSVFFTFLSSIPDPLVVAACCV